MASERRMFERLSCNFRVAVKDESGKVLGAAWGYDFSAGGIGLVFKRLAATVTRVTLDIYFSHKFEPITYRGKVVWQEKVGSDWYRAGVAFSPVNIFGCRPLLQACAQYSAV